KCGELSCILFELINLNTMSTSNVVQPYQDFAYSYAPTSLKQLRSSYAIDLVLIYNRDYTPSNTLIQSNFSNTYLSSESTNRFQASILFHNANTNSNQINNSEHKSMMSRNLIRPEQQHRSSSQLSTMSLDDILDLYSSASYDLTNRSQESLYQQNSHSKYKEKISNPNSQFHTSNLPHDIATQ
ncbi:7606_t:CDS:1, partial [Scutellospora calospora]